MLPVATYCPRAHWNRFLTALQVTPLADGVRWRLDAPLEYVDPDGNLVIVPAGFITDFASIPPLATIAGWVQLGLLGIGQMADGRWQMKAVWWAAMAFAWLVVMLANGMEHEGTWDEASCLHDYLYATRCAGFWRANWLLFKAMVAGGGGRTVLWKRWVIWQAVNLGGYIAWCDDARRTKGAKR